MFLSQTALWFTHSTPQFPFRRDQNWFWPDSGKDQGQTFLCVSLPFAELKSVGEHLQKIHAYPYDHDLPDTFPNELRNAARWVPSETQLGVLRSLQTRSDKQLRTMAKPLGYEASDGDLYVKLAAALGSDLDAQTWGCQPQRDESFCDLDEKWVMNVEQISTGRITLGSWPTRKDHSKWAVTTAPAVTWTCFGDVNRSPTQYERWGGALCINDARVNGLFKGFATGKLPCRKRPAPCTSSDTFGK
ncbi:plancitoxin-1-like [Boleophthalmus pectinirostris]|uniref:plancitoxin-1-like n=1 Tax=Boleophthalmus pectinirostris TaxID=150288 RepID=UPI00242B0971|nr:plancitoxin-1-like [Boleophthalmus pectinirostris]